MKFFLKKIIYFGVFLEVIISYAYALPMGSCGPVNNETSNFNFSVSNVVSNPSENTAGTVLPAITASSSGSFSVGCKCPTNDYIYTHQWTTTTLTPDGSSGGLNFYKVDDYLSVATEIKDNGNGEYYPTPWNDHYYPTGDGQECNYYISGYHTGNNIRATFRIDKAFIGTSNYNNLKILDLWYTTSDDFVQGVPVVSLYLTGQITVPQTCSVNAGQIVTVDFGSFMSGEFKNKGQMPTGYTPKTITVPIKCNGMDANASLTLRFQAEASADEPAAIKTSNDDVGVQLTDDSGKVIEPNSGLIPFQLDDNLQATVTFHAAPISTTGNAPAEGTFSATAYIRVDFA